MRRARRAKYENNKLKYVMYFTIFVILATISTFILTYIIYKNKLKNVGDSLLSTEQIIGLVPNEENEKTESASTEIGKTIEEIKNELEQDNNVEVNDEKTSIEELPATPAKEATPVVVEEKEPEFAYPVEGEILKEFAKENLIYSETLKEWVTHSGIDIKADRTAVVKASEAGKVVSIKNDPRYGLTVVIEHNKGYKTVYSNLLTTEFVSEGEEVEKGQSIGTVGNTASFEIANEPHLHFEIMKDNETLDPKTILK